VRNSCVEGREVKCFNTIAGGEWLKIKFYLLGIAAQKIRGHDRNSGAISIFLIKKIV
jgi:hypothetical protein